MQPNPASALRSLSPFRWEMVLAALALATALPAAETVPPQAGFDKAAVEAADDARCSAMIAGDGTRLSATLSDELHYVHSSGKIDTKASYVGSIVSGHQKYLSIQYENRTFTEAAPGIALMTGRGVFHSANDGKQSTLYLSFLAVWRLEGGSWRFLAWQSCHLEPPKPAAK